MSISIITVNYNNKKGLFKTLNSILPLRGKYFDQLVVDSKSPDMKEGDWNILQSDNISYISEKDKGVYDGMNKGASLTSGDYLFYLNSGDYLYDLKSLDCFLPYLGKFDLIYANVFKCKLDSIQKLTYPTVLTLEYMLIYGLPHQGILINRSLHNKIGGYNTNYKIISDWVFFMEAIFFHGATYIHVNEVVSVFDGHGMSQNNEHTSLIISEQLDYISKRFPSYINYYKLNSPYVKKYFRGIPRWKRFWKKYLFQTLNKI